MTLQSIKKQYNLLRARLWTVYYKLKLSYQHCPSKKRVVLFVSAPLILLLIIYVGISLSSQQETVHYRVNFTRPHPAPPPNDKKLELKVAQLQNNTGKQFQQLQNNLMNMNHLLNTLASKQPVTIPNPTILGKVDKLQDDVSTIIAQHQKKVFVNPQTVANHFQLVAIQGFSDGMRAIIDVDGNQTTLGIKESCPVCRGWVIQSMDFTKQSAVFENGHAQWLTLQAK